MVERKKRQPSNVDKLPVGVRRQLREMVDNPRITQLAAVKTINAILSELRAAGDPEALDPECPEKISKSGLSRAVQEWAEVGERLRQSREIGEMLISKVGAAPAGQVGLLINEMLRSLSFDLSKRLLNADLTDPEALTATIDQVKALALAVQRLEQSATINVKREAEIRKQAREEAAKAVEAEAKRQGASAATIDSLRAAIMTELGA